MALDGVSHLPPASAAAAFGVVGSESDTCGIVSRSGSTVSARPGVCRKHCTAALMKHVLPASESAMQSAVHCREGCSLYISSRPISTHLQAIACSGASKTIQQRSKLLTQVLQTNESGWHRRALLIVSVTMPHNFSCTVVFHPRPAPEATWQCTTACQPQSRLLLAHCHVSTSECNLGNRQTLRFHSTVNTAHQGHRWRRALLGRVSWAAAAPPLPLWPAHLC